MERRIRPSRHSPCDPHGSGESVHGFAKRRIHSTVLLRRKTSDVQDVERQENAFEDVDEDASDANDGYDSQESIVQREDIKSRGDEQAVPVQEQQQKPVEETSQPRPSSWGLFRRAASNAEDEQSQESKEVSESEDASVVSDAGDIPEPSAERENEDIDMSEQSEEKQIPPNEVAKPSWGLFRRTKSNSEGEESAREAQESEDEDSNSDEDEDASHHDKTAVLSHPSSERMVEAVAATPSESESDDNNNSHLDASDDNFRKTSSCETGAVNAETALEESISFSGEDSNSESSSESAASEPKQQSTVETQQKALDVTSRENHTGAESNGSESDASEIEDAAPGSKTIELAAKSKTSSELGAVAAGDALDAEAAAMGSSKGSVVDDGDSSSTSADDCDSSGAKGSNSLTVKIEKTDVSDELQRSASFDDGGSDQSESESENRVEMETAGAAVRPESNESGSGIDQSSDSEQSETSEVDDIEDDPDAKAPNRLLLSKEEGMSDSESESEENMCALESGPNDERGENCEEGEQDISASCDDDASSGNESERMEEEDPARPRKGCVVDQGASSDADSTSSKSESGHLKQYVHVDNHPRLHVAPSESKSNDADEVSLIDQPSNAEEDSSDGSKEEPESEDDATAAPQALVQQQPFQREASERPASRAETRNYENLAIAKALIQQEYDDEMLEDSSESFSGEQDSLGEGVVGPNHDSNGSTVPGSQDGPKKSVTSSQHVQEVAAEKAAEPAEEESSEEESGSEEDDSSDEEEGRHHRVVVKEAPLLRLENVTAMSRSNIPEKSMQKKNRGWGWFGRKGTQATDPAPPKIADSDTKEETATKTQPQPDPLQEAKAEPSEVGEQNETSDTPAVEKESTADPLAAQNSTHGKAASVKIATSAATVQEKKMPEPEPKQEQSAPLSPMKPADEPQTQLSPMQSPLFLPQSPLSPAKTSATLVPPISPSKSPGKKKKKKKGGIAEHFQQTAVRKVNKHGDEVSVGTMNFTKKKVSTREVVLQGKNALFDDQDLESLDRDIAGSKLRPWGKAIPKGRRTSTQKKWNDEDEDLEKIEMFGSTEEFFNKSSGSSVLDNSGDMETHLPAVIEDDGEESSDDEDDEEDHEKPEEAEEDEQNELEQRLGLDLDAPPDVDFDDMWDNVSCDVDTALEFERNKRKKNHEKEKKRQKREQEREEKANAARRLRLFDKRKEHEGQQKRDKKASKQSRLSDEFIDAIHKVFEDDSINSIESCSEDSDSDGDMYEKANASCGSLYLHGDDYEDKEIDMQSVGSKSMDEGASRKSKKSHRSRKSSKSRRKGDDASYAHSTTSSKRSIKSSSRAASKAKRAKRNEVDASAIFMREVAKLKRPKVLTVANLRQEMIDRRGTSANLLKKEYQTFKKNKHKNAGSEVQQLDFNALAAQKNGFELSSRRSGGGASNRQLVKPAASDQPEGKPRSDGLAATLSRWASTEGVSELDDLATVCERSKPATNLFGVANQIAKNAASNLPDAAHEVGEFAKEAGHAVQEKIGQAGKTIGSNIQHIQEEVQSGVKSVGHNLQQGMQNVHRGMPSPSQGGRSTSSLPSPAEQNIGLPTVSEDQPSVVDDSPMFETNFDAFEMPMIQEDDNEGDSDHGDDFGLLIRNSEEEDDDNRSYASSGSRRSLGSIKQRKGGFKIGKLGKKLKKFGSKVKGGGSGGRSQHGTVRMLDSGDW